MITRFVIAGLLFVTLSSGLAYAFDSEDDTLPSPEPAIEEPAPETPADAPAEAPAPETPAP